MTIRTLIAFITLATFIGCQTNSTTDNTVPDNQRPDTTAIANNDVENPCDTTKFPDFRTNLNRIFERPMGSDPTLVMKRMIDKKAQDFIDQMCKTDSLYCGTITPKEFVRYQATDYNDYEIWLRGYILDQETGMDEDAASFFVIMALGEQYEYTEILDDLMGEIKVDLKGLEIEDGQLIVWGEAYPYFQPDYGRFKLTMTGQTGEFEFECHADKH